MAGGIIRLSLRTQATSALAIIGIGFALSLTALEPSTGHTPSSRS